MLGYCLLQALYFGNARVLSPGLGFRVYQCWVIFFHCEKEHFGSSYAKAIWSHVGSSYQPGCFLDTCA
jgi:hypothetical protein